MNNNNTPNKNLLLKIGAGLLVFLILGYTLRSGCNNNIRQGEKELKDTKKELKGDIKALDDTKESVLKKEEKRKKNIITYHKAKARYEADKYTEEDLQKATEDSLNFLVLPMHGKAILLTREVRY